MENYIETIVWLVVIYIVLYFILFIINTIIRIIEYKQQEFHNKIIQESHIISINRGKYNQKILDSSPI